MNLKQVPGKRSSLLGYPIIRGVVWVKLHTGYKTHILIDDLDGDSKNKVLELIESCKNG
jgi:hypothetical protein